MLSLNFLVFSNHKYNVLDFAAPKREVGCHDEGLGEKLGERLGENQKLILKLMNEDPHITIPKIARRIDISTTAVENNIAKLKKKGLLRRVGPAKGGYWEIIKKS